MASLLSSPTFSISPSRRNKPRRKNKKIHHQLSNRNNNFFPSTSSPPLLGQPPYIQTKHQALDLVLKDLQASLSRGVEIEPEIFSSLLETCFRLQSLWHGVELHRLIPPTLLRKRAYLSAKLLRLYASFGLVDEAHQLFDQMTKRDVSVFAWNSLISGYAELGMYEDALALYFQMEEDGVKPDRYTFPRVLKACAGIGSIRVGEAVHRHIVRLGLFNDLFVLNALVDMYAKCGDILKAQKIFNELPQRDSVSWNSMLTGYIRHGLLPQAVKVFCQMLNAGFEPDSVTISTVVAKCESLKLGLEMHGWVYRHAVETNLSIANSLITMYSQHGQVDRARRVFDNMPERDIISWNAVIQCNVKRREALVLFELMENSGVPPDGVTFVSLLSACANLSLVEDGRRLFRKMEEIYGINAGMEHYGCMVNLLGRAGLVEEAYELIEKRIKFEGGPTVWGALLFACSVHGNVKIAEVAGERLFELEPDNAHNFELLMKIYRKAGRFEEEEKVRRLMRDRGLGS